jgi:integrase
MSKGADGGGSVYQRKSDGRWVGAVMVGYLPNGKIDRRTVYAATEKDARKKLAEVVRNNDRGTLPAKQTLKDTVGGYLETWLESQRGSLKPNTYIRYCQLLRLHVVPEIGTVKLASLKPEDVQKMYSRLLAKRITAGQGASITRPKTISPRTVHHVHVVLHTALEQAVRWERLYRNVCDVVDAPRVTKLETYTPSTSEVMRLLATSADDPFLPLWTVAALTGARLGELLALQWSDVNLDKKVVNIRRTLLTCTRNGIPAYGEPKSKAGWRTVPLGSRVVAALQALRQTQLEQRLRLGEAYQDHSLIFCSHTGTPLSHRNVERAFKAALQRAGMPEITRLHDLRHAAVSTLIDAGNSAVDVAKLVGHHSGAFTMLVYAHAKGRDVAAMDSLERAYGG